MGLGHEKKSALKYNEGLTFIQKGLPRIDLEILPHKLLTLKSKGP